MDDGRGMQRRELARYHDVAASTKARGEGIGFAGVGIKLGLLVVARGGHGNEARRDARRDAMAPGVAASRAVEMDSAAWSDGPRGTAVRLTLTNQLSPLLDAGYLEEAVRATLRAAARCRVR